MLQEKYVEWVLSRLNIKSAKPSNTSLANHFTLGKKFCPSRQEEKEDMITIVYFHAIRSLMYAMFYTWIDITYLVGLVNKFFYNPCKDHWEAMMWIFRYLKGTSKMCLGFRDLEPILEGYTTVDMVGDLDSRKSTSRFVSWQSKLWKCVALCSTETKYMFFH